MANGRKSGRGIPFPAGVCRLYKSDVDESKQLIGEDRIEHTPRDENIILTTGKAFDVVGECAKTSQKVLAKRSRKESRRIRVKTHKRKKVSVHVVEKLNPAAGGTDREIVTESQPHAGKTPNAIECQVKAFSEKHPESLIRSPVAGRGPFVASFQFPCQSQFPANIQLTQ